MKILKAVFSPGTSAFFFEIALMMSYARRSGMLPTRLKIRITCSW